MAMQILLVVIAARLHSPGATSDLRLTALHSRLMRTEHSQLDPFLQNLPRDLLDLGLATFHSQSALSSFLRTLRGPQHVNVYGVPAQMFAASGDNVIQRLDIDDQSAGGDAYHLHDVQSSSGGVLVDVGGNIGDVAVAAALLQPNLQILTLEPSPATYFVMRLNLRINGVAEISEGDFGKPARPGVLALNKAVTADGRDVVIHQNANSTLDEYTGPTDSQHGGHWDTSSATVGSLALPSYLASHSIDSVVFFKIDCEGCEFDVLPQMQQLVSDSTKVKRFAAELHQYMLKDTVRRPSDEAVRNIDAMLSARGCQTVSSGAWHVNC